MTSRSRIGTAVATKVTLSFALVMIAAAIVGVGAFAVFTDTQSVSQATTSGVVSLNPVSGDAVNNRLSVGASNVAAGDSVQRTVDVKNSGAISLATVTLTTTATTSSLLDTDVTNGLQLKIERCSVGWTETGGPPYTYACGGTTSTVVASRPVVGAILPLASLTLTPGTDNFLRVTLTLPVTAPNTLQGQASTINYAFTATQRAGQAQ